MSKPINVMAPVSMVGIPIAIAVYFDIDVFALSRTENVLLSLFTTVMLFHFDHSMIETSFSPFRNEVSKLSERHPTREPRPLHPVLFVPRTGY
jgi:hypothetical protein